MKKCWCQQTNGKNWAAECVGKARTVGGPETCDAASKAQWRLSFET